MKTPSLLALCLGVSLLPIRLSAAENLAELAAKGEPEAQFQIGVATSDVAEAARWFRKAADQGHALAQVRLAGLYVAGQGVSQNTVEAFVLYSLASERDNPPEDAIAGRERAEKQLTAEELELARKRVVAARALIAVHPRRFGAPGLIGKSRGWWVWNKWNAATWEAEVTPDPPGEVLKVRVLPWATTYRHLTYGGRFDELLPGEKVNVFFDADEHHRRGYVVHFQDEISQMKGHGHAWQIREVTMAGAGSPSHGFIAQVFAGDKPLDEKRATFEIDPKCRRWRDGRLVDEFPLAVGDRVYLTWVYREGRRVVMLLTDDASLETLKRLETQRVATEVAAEGMAGQLDTIGPGGRVQFLVYSTYWSQAGQLKAGQPVRLATAGPGFRPTDLRVPAKVLSHKNRGVYGSGVKDVLLELDKPADAERLRELEGRVLRLIP